SRDDHRSGVLDGIRGRSGRGRRDATATPRFEKPLDTAPQNALGAHTGAPCIDRAPESSPDCTSAHAGRGSARLGVHIAGVDEPGTHFGQSLIRRHPQGRGAAPESLSLAADWQRRVAPGAQLILAPTALAVSVWPAALG